MVSGLDLSPGSSALVVLDDNGGVLLSKHFSEDATKWDLRARLRMARTIYTEIGSHEPDLVAIEDYDLSMGQHVSYQIAEVGGIVKCFLLENAFNVMLVHPRKRQSFVARRRKVTKNDCIDWAEANGFPLPAKKPGLPGLYKREREDLADAFIISCMAHRANLLISEGTYTVSSVKGDLFLDPETGLLKRPDLLFLHGDPARPHVKAQ